MIELLTYIFIGIPVLLAALVGGFIFLVVVAAVVVYPALWLAQVFGIVTKSENT